MQSPVNFSGRRWRMHLFRNHRARVVGVVALILTALLLWSSAPVQRGSSILPVAEGPVQAESPKVVRCCADSVEAASDVAATEQAVDPVFAEFETWAKEYKDNAPQAEVERGVTLAEKRIVALEKLIVADPQRAL